jgi:hypothetical protein
MIQCVAKKSNPNSDRSRWCSFSGRTPYPRAARCNAADNSPLALTIREERQIVISLLPDWIDRRGEAHPAHGDRHDPGPRERNFSRRRGRASRRTRRRPRPRSGRKFRAGRPRLATAGNGRPPRTMANCLARGSASADLANFARTRKAASPRRSVTAGYAGDADNSGTSSGAPDEDRARLPVYEIRRHDDERWAGGPPGECGWRLRLD